MASLMRNIVKCCSSFAEEGFRDFHDIPVLEEEESTQTSPTGQFPISPFLKRASR